MRRGLQILRARLGPATLPCAYLVLVALPLALWASPQVDRLATGRLAAGLGLFVAAVLGARAPRPPWPARAYFALGAGFALAHAHVPPNELAGILLLFAPPAAALAAGGGAVPGVWRLQALLLSLLFGGLLAATGSRGGVLALAAGLAAVLVLKGRVRLLLLGLLGAALLAWAAPSRWLDPLLYGGSIQGLTADTLLTGRPEIWRRSLHAIADFFLTGLGVGTYDTVVPSLYHPAGAGKVLEDAHSLPLQTALDLGAGGLAAVAAIVGHAFLRLIRFHRRAPAGLARTWAGGLFGSLAAFTAFNLFDAVALGSAGGLAFWGLLGLVYALPRRGRRRPRRRRWRPRTLGRARRRLVLAALLLLLGVPSLRGALELNRAAVLAARAAVSDRALLPRAQAALAAVSARTCRAGWLEGKVAALRGRSAERDAAWARLLACSASFVPLVEGEAPDSLTLARRAVGAQPAAAEAHFWLARVHARAGERAAARRSALRGLALDPRNGRAWLELGHLVARDNPWAALAAYAESCRYGDPGANGCLSAGALAEHLGDREAALGFYRRSRYPPAREAAERLARGP